MDEVTAGKRSTIEFRLQLFEEITDEMGLTTTEAKARLVGCGYGTMWRIREGIQGPSAKFIAGVLSAFPTHSYSDFFYSSGSATSQGRPQVRAAA